MSEFPHRIEHDDLDFVLKQWLILGYVFYHESGSGGRVIMKVYREENTSTWPFSGVDLIAIYTSKRRRDPGHRAWSLLIDEEERGSDNSDAPQWARRRPDMRWLLAQMKKRKK